MSILTLDWVANQKLMWSIEVKTSVSIYCLWSLQILQSFSVWEQN